jgi:NADPH:quinone reductase-like Zn-dependent oxidoreductase
MKAVFLKKYGSPDHLEITEVNKPLPRDNEVLVRVHAASLNSWDKDIINGIPFANRMDFGIRKPKARILGIDMAGQVEEVGHKVKELQKGDKIFGDISGCGMGAFAEYVCVPEKILAVKPEAMTYEEAAAIPHTGVLALQGLRDKGHIQKGQKVLINGAGGGSGTFAVQLAKLFGAEVTCVDTSPKFDMLRSIGTDHVIDYTKEDFAGQGLVYDLILDVVTYRSISDYKRVLGPGGIYVMMGGGSYSRVFKNLIQGSLISMKESLFERGAGRKMGLLMHKPNKKDLQYLTELFEAGRLTPVIDKSFRLSEVVEAFHYYGENLACGKVIITV